MNIARIPYKINLLLFFITLYLNFTVQWDPSRWDGFHDVKDYLRQSNYSLFSKDFFLTQPKPGFYPRPFTVPLCYKMAGSRGETIVKMQKFIHSLSVFVLVYSMLLLLKTGFVRYFIMFSIYFLMSWWNILGWTTQLLSESLSMSFLFLWLGTFLLYYSKRKPWILIIHGFITILFSFTRDSWPYLLIFLYGIMIVIAWLWNKPLLRGSVIMLLLSLTIYFIQGKSSEIGQRTKLPVINNIILRILPEPEYYNWFVIKGLPTAGLIKQQFSGIDISKEHDLWKIWGLYTDPAYLDFQKWAADHGKGLYSRFLITHPLYSLLLKEPESKLKRIFVCNLNYVTPVNGYSQFAEKWFPFFSPLSLLIFSLLLVWLFMKTRKTYLLLPLVFGLLFLFNVFLIYNADTMEVERHLFITMIMVQLLSIWSVSLLIDEALIKIKSAKVV
jgi:hypothetical protein